MSSAVHPLISPAVRRQTIADALRRTALRLPNKLGIVCGDTAWTYAEFDALVSRLAAGLSGIGVKRIRVSNSTFYNCDAQCLMTLSILEVLAISLDPYLPESQ